MVDTTDGSLRQLPSIFAGAGGSYQSRDGRYVVFVGSAGATLEAVDVVAGTHAVLDAVQPPFTFLSSPEGGQDISLSESGPNVVTYGLYDSSSPSGAGYLLLETRTADIDAALNPGATVIDPQSFQSPAMVPDPPSSADPLAPDDPFSNP